MKDEEKLKKIALKVLSDAGIVKESAFGSTIAILMIVSIILTCIRVIQECNQKSI